MISIMPTIPSTNQTQKLEQYRQASMKNAKKQIMNRRMTRILLGVSTELRQMTLTKQ